MCVAERSEARALAARHARAKRATARAPRRMTARDSAPMSAPVLHAREARHKRHMHSALATRTGPQ